MSRTLTAQGRGGGLDARGSVRWQTIELSRKPSPFFQYKHQNTKWADLPYRQKSTAALPAGHQLIFILILKSNLFRIPRITVLTPIVLQASRTVVGSPQCFKDSSRPRLPNCSVDNSEPFTTPLTS